MLNINKEPVPLTLKANQSLMDHGEAASNILTEQCSVVSGSSGKSGYNDICTPLLTTSQLLAPDVSPLVPLQDIFMGENDWNSTCKDKDDEHIAKEIRSVKSLDNDNKLSVMSQATSFGTSLDELCRNNTTHLEDSQVDSDNVPAQSIQFLGLENPIEKPSDNLLLLQTPAAVNSIACTIPTNASDNRHSVRSPNKDDRIGKNVFPTEVHACSAVQQEISFLIEDSDANSDTSIISTIPPDKVVNESRCSAPKFLSLSSQLDFENVHSSERRFKYNQDSDLQSLLLPKDTEGLKYQEHTEMTEQDATKIQNVSLSSQGTKSSPDLFLSSAEVSHSQVQNMSQDLQRAFKNTASTSCDIPCEKPWKNLEREEDNGCQQKISSSRSQSKPKEESFQKCNDQRDPSPHRLKRNESILKEHQRKMSPLQRFESLCSQIESRLDSRSCGNAYTEMESCVQRCEQLLSKMHAMQKEEKARLCSSLKEAGMNKQKKRVLKVELEHLKTRHQSLIAIANKYGKIKKRVFSKGEEFGQHALIPPHDSSQALQLPNSGNSDYSVGSSNYQPVPCERSQRYTSDINVSNHKECVENPSSISVAEPIALIPMSVSSNTGDTLFGKQHVLMPNIDTNGQMQSGLGIDKDVKANLPKEECRNALCVERKSTKLQDGVSWNERKMINSIKGEAVSKENHVLNCSTVTGKNCDIKRKSNLLSEKGKILLKFDPAIKRKVESQVHSVIPIHSSFNDQFIASSLSKTIPQLVEENCFGISAPCEKETLMYVDNILFTEFQDPSLLMDTVTLQARHTECRSDIGHTSLNNETVKNKSGSIAAVGCVGNDMRTDVQDTSSTNKGTHVCAEPADYSIRHEARCRYSDLHVPQLLSQNGACSQYCSNTVNIGRFQNINDPINCTDSSNQSNQCEDVILVDSTVTAGLGVSSMLPSAKENISKGTTDVDITEKVQNSVPRFSPTGTNPPSKETHPIGLHTNNPCNVEGSVSNTCSNLNGLASACKPISYGKPYNNQIPSTSRQSEGPASPCSTKGSSLFPVSSKEIIRRVQTRQLAPIGSTIDARDKNCHETKIQPKTASERNGTVTAMGKEKTPVLASNICYNIKPSNKRRLPISQQCLTDDSNRPPNAIVIEPSNPSPNSTGLEPPSSTQVSSQFPVRLNGNRQTLLHVPNTIDNKTNLPKIRTNTLSKKKDKYMISQTTPIVSFPTNHNISMPTQSGSSRLYLEPSAISLNNIMTSSLCIPMGTQHSDKDSSKPPKRPRKRKPKMDSRFTQTSPKMPIGGVCLTEKDKTNSCVAVYDTGKSMEIVDDHITNDKDPCEFFSKSTCDELTDIDNNISSTSTSITTTKPFDLQASNNKMASQESFNLHKFLNGLRTVQLISDQELFPPYKGGFPSSFWDEDFAGITMSKSFWDSAVEW